jgi:exopolyphosphatase / guanosine-5'-triphosphate,3'-diphosphate pyrophosphatase
VTRIACIDIGTNTVLLTIAEVRKNGEFEPIFELSRLSRLGEGVDQTRALGRAAMERTLVVLSEYEAICQAHRVTRLGVTGTSALRDARGADEFLEAARSLLRTEVEVASGLREAELTYRGAALGLREDETQTRFVFDVGGGSTELILGQGVEEVTLARSLDLGSVRLFERHNRAILGSDLELEALDRELEFEFSSSELADSFWSEPALVIGVAGTVASLFSIHKRQGLSEPGVAQGGLLSLSEVREVRSRLVGMSLEERNRIPCLGVGRADVIVYGASIVLHILERRARFGVDPDPSLVVSERGVRFGRLLELAKLELANG